MTDIREQLAAAAEVQSTINTLSSLAESFLVPRCLKGLDLSALQSLIASQDAEIDRLKAALAHCTDNAGDDSCAGYALENERLRKAMRGATP